MAALGSYDFRTPTLEDYINFEHELDVIQRKGGTKQDLKILFMECTMPSGATMIAADSGRTAEFNGVAVPIIIYAISSDNVEDKAGQDGALEVTVFGFEENDLYVEEAILLNGTTQVAGTIKFKRLIGAKLTECGVDGVGTGNVTISNTGQAATYLTIPAGQAGTAQAGKVYIPAGYKGLIVNFDAHFINLPGAAAFSRVEGTNIWIRRYDGDSVTEDELHQYTISTSKILPSKPHWEILNGGAGVFFDVFHQSVNTGTTDHNVHYDIHYLIWKEA